MGRPFEFNDSVKGEACVRQEYLCACCGEQIGEHCDRSGGMLVDVYIHGHHVVPNQVGRPGNVADRWIATSENCVILCDTCHYRVHQNGNYRFGAVAPAEYFPYSHGSRTLEHAEWVARVCHMSDR